MPPLVVEMRVHPSMKTWLGSANLARRETAVSGYNPLGRALHDHPMNRDDEEIRLIARSGGVVGVIFLSDWLFPRGGGREDRLANVVETVRHIQQAGGEDVVVFGSDFDGMTDPPDDLREPADFPRLLAALEGAGFTGRQIEQFAGRNLLRGLRAGWQ